MKALVWELSTPKSPFLIGMRFLLVGNLLAHQDLDSRNQRPRWITIGYATPADAAAVARAYTRDCEAMFDATVAVAPVEIMVHPAEVAQMGDGSSIHPALRARAYTALKRKRGHDATG